MKSILKEIWVYVVIIVLAAMLATSISKTESLRSRSSQLEDTISNLNQEIAEARIRLNDSTEVYQATVKSLSATARNIQSRYNRLLKASNLKAKDVGSVTEIVNVVQSTDTVIAEVDTFGGIKASLRDPFVSIDVDVTPERKAIIDYEVKDSITVINVQKKHSWLFGLIKWKEHKETRVINHNPKARTSDLKVLEVID